MRRTWPFTFYFLLFAGMASLAPFVVLYYQDLGFTGTQIGLLMGITPLITFFSAPLWAGVADATGRHRRLMSIAMLGGVTVLCLFPLLAGFVPVLLAAIALHIFLAPVTPFADSATMSMLAGQKEMYGRVRLGGTIGYGLAGLPAGLLVQSHGLRYAFWACATLLLLGFVVSQRLAYGVSETRDSFSWSRIRTLVASPRWLVFLVVALTAGASLAAVSNYLFPYMKQLGADESTMGLALMAGTLSEIPVLFFGNRLIRRLRPYGLLMLSLVIIGLRTLLLVASRTPGQVLAVQLLNGLAFPAFWVAGVSYADADAPPGMTTTAQGLFGAVVAGIGTALGGLVGGPLLESSGGQGLFSVFGVAVLAAAAIAMLIQARLGAEPRTSPGVADG